MAVCNRCKRFYNGSREEHERLYCDSTVRPDPKDRERVEFVRRAAIRIYAGQQPGERCMAAAVHDAQLLWETLRAAGC